MVALLASRLGGWAIGGLAALIFFGLWQISSAKVDVMKAREEVYRANIISLKSVIKSNESAIDFANKMHDADQARLEDYESEAQKRDAYAAKLEEENHALRITEEGAALKEPYERGLAAYARINRIMRRASEDRNDQDSINPKPEQPDNP